METEHTKMAQFNAKLPTSIRYLIEALRGGGRTYYSEDGKPEAQYFGPRKEPAPFKNKGLRGYQLENQERQARGEAPISYEEWLKSL